MDDINSTSILALIVTTFIGSFLKGLSSNKKFEDQKKEHKAEKSEMGTDIKALTKHLVDVSTNVAVLLERDDHNKTKIDGIRLNVKELYEFCEKNRTDIATIQGKMSVGK